MGNPSKPKKIQAKTSGRKPTQEELQMARELTAIKNIARSVSSSLTLNEITKSALASIQKAVKPDLSFLFIRESERLILNNILPANAKHRYIDVPEHRVGECICGLVVQEKKPLFSYDIFKDKRCTWQQCKRAGVKSFAALPLLNRADVIGVIGLASDSERDFEKQSEFLETLADLVSSAMINAQLYEKAQQELTERKIAESNLQREKERTQQYLDVAGVLLLALDIDQKVTLINPKGCEILGYSADEVIGCNWFDNFLPQENIEEVKQVFKQIISGDIEPTEFFENPILRKNGECRTIAWHNSLLHSESGDIIGVFCSGEDITERKQAEEEIQKNLKEKEVLLKEIHHRVKNNMQVISSLLRLQLDEIRDEDARDRLKRSGSRIKSIALVHEELYRSKNLAEISFSQYIRRLAAHILSIYSNPPGDIELEIELAEIYFSVNTAVPLGLIANELLTNSVIHGFPSGRLFRSKTTVKNKIFVALYPEKSGNSVMMIKDNGVGMPPGLDYRKAETLGLQIVRDLVKQIDGSIKLDKRNGTSWRITLPGQ